MKTTLVILAAGLGSRFGGYKQVQGFGPNGEILMEYSIFDAIQAGFDKIVLLIKPEMQETMDQLCLNKLRAWAKRTGKKVEVCCAYQDYSSIPAQYIPAGRTKPFGTTHAMLCAEDRVQEAFAILNADDYYGPNALKAMHEALLGLTPGEGCMVGYLLKNTVSDFGAVTRGVCSAQNGYLSAVKETYSIRPEKDGTIVSEIDGGKKEVLDPMNIVSMNFWGFLPEIFAPAGQYFDAFLKGLKPDDVKKECLLPIMVDDMIHTGSLKIKMLQTDAVWFGVTYQEDLPQVKEELKKLHENGTYPKELFAD